MKILSLSSVRGLAVWKCFFVCIRQLARAFPAQFHKRDCHRALHAFEIHINPEKKMKQIPAAQEGIGGAETEKFSKPKKGKKKFGIPAAQETALLSITDGQ